jgi:hypothetical protein
LFADRDSGEEWPNWAGNGVDKRPTQTGHPNERWTTRVAGADQTTIPANWEQSGTTREGRGEEEEKMNLKKHLIIWFYMNFKWVFHEEIKIGEKW